MSDLDRDKYFEVCTFGSLAKVKSLLKGNEEDVDVCDLSMSSPLHYTCKYGHNELFDYLIELGHDIELTDELMDTQLSIALTYNRVYMVKKLIEKGANLCANVSVFDTVETIFYDAVKKDNVEVISLLVPDYFDPCEEFAEIGYNTFIKLALRHDSVNCVGYFLNNGVDINGESLLHYAVDLNAINTARYLIENGLSQQLLVLTDGGDSVMDYALGTDSQDMISFIEQELVKVSSVNLNAQNSSLKI